MTQSPPYLSYHTNIYTLHLCAFVCVVGGVMLAAPSIFPVFKSIISNPNLPDGFCLISSGLVFHSLTKPDLNIPAPFQLQNRRHNNSVFAGRSFRRSCTL